MTWNVPSKRVFSDSKGDRRWNSDTQEVEEWDGEEWVQVNPLTFPLETIPFKDLEFGKTYRYHLFKVFVDRRLFQIYEEGICSVVSYKPDVISLEFIGIDHELLKNKSYIEFNMTEEEYNDSNYILRYKT